MSLTVGQISTVCQGKSQTALAFGTYCTFACVGCVSAFHMEQ